MFFQKHTYVFSETYLCFFRDITMFFQRHNCAFSETPVTPREKPVCKRQLRMLPKRSPQAHTAGASHIPHPSPYVSQGRPAGGSLLRHPGDGTPCLRLNLRIRFIR